VAHWGLLRQRKKKELAIKCQLDATDEFLLQILLLAQHVSGTIMIIIRSSRVLYRWLLPVVFGALVFKLSVWCGAEGCVSGLRAAAAPYRQFEKLENLSTKYHRHQPPV
jgi:hypothetical protein